MKLNASKLSVAVIAAMGLAACGDHHHDSNNPAPDADDSVYLNVQVVDGPLENACGWVDLNGNYERDDGESRACTDATGKAKFEMKKASLKNSDGSEKTQLRVIFEAKKGSAKDHVFGQEKELLRDLVLSGYTFGSNGVFGDIVVSPFSTYVSMALTSDDMGEPKFPVVSGNYI